VVLACRSRSKGEGMVRALGSAAQAAGRPPPSLEVSLLDLASLESVRAFVGRWEAQRRPLHVLINNAGVFNMGGACRPVRLRRWCAPGRWRLSSTRGAAAGRHR
jgi:NAD(P)-dependent dehydrogenase (short-subunit alcohol dehydrogenase family)